jgi:prepilin-type N-terminal cleavage/methylation domain-containing protein
VAVGEQLIRIGFDPAPPGIEWRTATMIAAIIGPAGSRARRGLFVHPPRASPDKQRSEIRLCGPRPASRRKACNRTAMPTVRRQPLAATPSGRAFTLVEMLCVITILGIASAIVVPMMGSTADVRLAAAQRALLADLQYAQGVAVAGRQSVYVRCVADQYEVCTLVGSTLTPVTHPTKPGKFVVRYGAAAADRALTNVSLTAATFGNGDRTLGFDAAGVPFSFAEASGIKSSVASRSEFKLTASGLTRSVYVEAFTGELRVP